MKISLLSRLFNSGVTTVQSLKMWSKKDRNNVPAATTSESKFIMRAWLEAHHKLNFYSI